MGALITDDTDKKKLLMAECAIETDNEYVMKFAQMLNPGQTQLELQQQGMLEQADQEIKARDQQIVELQKQLQDLQLQSQIQQYSLDREMKLSELKHKQDLEKLAFEAQLEQSNPAEQAKQKAEVIKAQAGIEKSLIDLRKTQVKAVEDTANGGEG